MIESLRLVDISPKYCILKQKCLLSTAHWTNRKAGAVSVFVGSVNIVTCHSCIGTIPLTPSPSHTHTHERARARFCMRISNAENRTAVRIRGRSNQLYTRSPNLQQGEKL